MCVCVVIGPVCSVRGGCGCVRAPDDGHLHAPHRHLPPPLPLLRGEGGAGGPRASHWRMVPKHISDVSRCSDWRVL